MSEQLFSQNEGSTDGLGDLLGKILGSQIQGTGEVTGSEGSPSSINSNTNAGGNSSPVGDIFSSLLSNPDLLLKLPSIISAAKPIIDMFSQSQKNQVSNDATTASESVAAGSVLASPERNPSRVLGREAECRNALLCAMKPYLSSDRQNAIDYIIKLSRLGDILKTL